MYQSLRGLPRGLRGLPATFLRELEAHKARRACRRALGGLAVAEPGEDPIGLLPGAQALGTAGGRDVRARAQVVDELPRRVRGLVVAELPVDQDDRGRVLG